MGEKGYWGLGQLKPSWKKSSLGQFHTPAKRCPALARPHCRFVSRRAMAFGDWQGIRWQNSVRLTIGVELPHTHLAKAENWSGFGAIWLILLCFLSSLVSCSFVRCLLTNLLRSDLGLPSWSTDFFLASY